MVANGKLYRWFLKLINSMNGWKNIFLVCAACFATPAFSQQPGVANKNYRDEAQLLKNAILANHYSPRKIDDQFSKWVYHTFLNELDPDRLYFTQEDLKILEPYYNKIDDEFNGTTFLFLPAITRTYKKCLQRADVIADEIFQDSFSFNIQETFQPDTL